MYKDFLKKLAVKAIRRAAGVAMAMIPASLTITDVDWRAIWLSAVTAAVLTVLADFSKFPMPKASKKTKKGQKVTKSDKKDEKEQKNA